MTRILFRSLTALLIAVNLGSKTQAADGLVTITPHEGKMIVRVRDELFCEVDYRTHAKPIVYPIYAPGQIPMTRDYPMKRGTAFEETDHPHHKSMWFGHGDVNGVSFWDERGKVITERAEIIGEPEDSEVWQGQPTLRLENQLVDRDGKSIGRETMWLSFGANEHQRWIDWQIEAQAGDTPLVFGDTKEGTAALRVHPLLRPDNRATQKAGSPPAHAINSEGIEGGKVWGKRAKWVDYSGTIEGRPVGVAFFDHPRNLRHPTYWHARDYGLFSANPFGISDFDPNSGNGSYTVPAGKSLVLRYRLIFHAGDAKQANIEQQYQQYVQSARG
jgi:hypothetical protein